MQEDYLTIPEKKYVKTISDLHLEILDAEDEAEYWHEMYQSLRRKVLALGISVRYYDDY